MIIVGPNTEILHIGAPKLHNYTTSKEAHAGFFRPYQALWIPMTKMFFNTSNISKSAFKIVKYIGFNPFCSHVSVITCSKHEIVNNKINSLNVDKNLGETCFSINHLEKNNIANLIYQLGS